jgi:hypothetical protein
MRACLAGVTAEHAADERFTRPEQAAGVVANGEARSGLRHRRSQERLFRWWRQRQGRLRRRVERGGGGRRRRGHGRRARCCLSCHCREAKRPLQEKNTGHTRWRDSLMVLRSCWSEEGERSLSESRSRGAGAGQVLPASFLFGSRTIHQSPPPFPLASLAFAFLFPLSLPRLAIGKRTSCVWPRGKQALFFRSSATLRLGFECGSPKRFCFPGGTEHNGGEQSNLTVVFEHVNKMFGEICERILTVF